MPESTAPQAPICSVKVRPALFRALGKDDAPEIVRVGGTSFQRKHLFKHDSWAATAHYVSACGKEIVCKFNRRQSILGFPMGWLGRYLARHEAHLLHLLGDLANIPPESGSVEVNGVIQKNAVAHAFIPGQPLRKDSHPGLEFFRQLEATLQEMHRRGIAYVDLHKRENILVGADGLPYMIDFQISQALPKWGPLGWILRILQQSDSYHLRKHILHFEPAFFGTTTPEEALKRPLWIRLHRMIAVPFRTLRRKLLVLFGIRSGHGSAESEVFPEEGIRKKSAA
ncbi:MAG: hypothetical protein EXS11_02095 [Gemmataceae bacterium]|nr:hypothetical protein [Gemmataceae bacterium]